MSLVFHLFHAADLTTCLTNAKTFEWAWSRVMRYGS